jgi:hypothetical protein
MVWSLSHKLKFSAASKEEEYKVYKMMKAFKVFRVKILDVAYTVLIQNTQAYATPNVTNFAAEFLEIIRAIADGFAVSIEMKYEPSEERMKDLLKALRCDIDHKEILDFFIKTLEHVEHSFMDYSDSETNEDVRIRARAQKILNYPGEVTKS